MQKLQIILQLAKMVTFSNTLSKGKSQELNLTGVSCISERSGLYIKTIASIDVNDNCANLYQSSNCGGFWNVNSYYTVRPGTVLHHDLSFWSVSSIGPCFGSCHEDHVETREISISVELFDEENYTGETFAFDVTLDTCITIPLRMSDKASSFMVHPTEKKYIKLLLYSGWDCRGESMTIGGSYSTFKDYFGSKYRDWGQSMSFRGYNCRTGPKKIITSENPVPENGYKYAAIHRFPDFKGNNDNAYVSIFSCLTFHILMQGSPNMSAFRELDALIWMSIGGLKQTRLAFMQTASGFMTMLTALGTTMIYTPVLVTSAF